MIKKTILGASMLAAVCLSPLHAARTDVWFCPLDTLARTGPGYTGVPQYMDLFKEDAPWQEAAGHVKILKIYPLWVEQASDADMKKQFAWLKRHGIGVALEYGALTPRSAADYREGFGGKTLLWVIRRIEENGGDLKYVAMDEPFCLSLTIGARPPVMSIQEIADNATKNIREALAVYPNIKFGDIEPLGISDFQGSIDAYKAGWAAFERDGVKLAFFDADLDWKAPGVMKYLSAMRDAAHEAGMSFGIIYDGDPSDQSDAEWLQSTQRHMTWAEATVGTPDTVIFQTWHPYPKKLLPERDADAFTHVINTYFRSRTKLTFDTVGGSISGRLVTEDGRPVAGVPIQVTAESLAPDGVMATYSSTGVVPPGCVTVCFGLRAIQGGWPGGACVGIKELKVETKNGFSTSQSFESPDCLTNWGGIGIGEGGRTFLSGGILWVNPSSQMLEYNSSHVPADISGQQFTFTVQAQVPPSGADFGSCGVFFLGPKDEVLRSLIPFQTASTPIGTAVTKASGSWSLSLPEQKNPVDIKASYAGDEKLWPAQKVLEVSPSK